MIKRLSTINLTSKVSILEYDLPKTLDSPYIVDDSGFVPMSEAIKSLSRIGSTTEADVNASYDFPNGVDTGIKVPIQRMHGVSDITEVSSAIMEQVEDITNKMEKGKKRVKAQADFNAALEKANSVSSFSQSASQVKSE